MNTPETPSSENVPDPLDPAWGALLAELSEELTAHPHDALIKRVLSTHLSAATELFRSRLNSALAASIDWSTLAVESASFVKRDLKRSHSDLLFSVRRNGKKVLMYLLFEHQSTIDPSMPLWLLGDMVEIWFRHREQFPTGPLPVVIPFVLHQGPGNWTVSTQFADQFWDAENRENWDDLLPYLPKFGHVLLDLPAVNPLTEMQDLFLKLTLYVMQQARVADSLQDSFALIDAEYATSINLDLFRLLLLYALHVENSLDVEKLLRETLTHQNLRTTAMTPAAKLIAEGEARGKAAGRLMGSITTLEQVLNLPTTPLEILESMSVPELEESVKKLRTQHRERVPESR